MRNCSRLDGDGRLLSRDLKFWTSLTACSLPHSSNASINNQTERVFRTLGRDDLKKPHSSSRCHCHFFTRLAHILTFLFKGVDEIWQCAGGLPEDLMKERPEEAERRPLEF